MKARTLKGILREQCLPELKARCAYFDVATLRAWLKGKRVPYKHATLNRYMVELAESGFVWSAGRGWYSFLSKPVQLDTAPLAEITKDLRERFPLLDFACWSTRQVSPYMHHMLGKFVTFIHAPRDTMETVYATLRKLGHAAHLNPTKTEAAKSFSVEDRTVVVRPLLSKTPAREHAETVEGILVDLHVELRTLPLMDVDEFRGMALRVLTSGRVDMAELVSYADRRGVALPELISPSESIISSFASNRR